MKYPFIAVCLFIIVARILFGFQKEKILNKSLVND